MPRLKIVYILSLVILIVLIVFTVFKPMVTGGEYSEVQGAQLLETEDEWIIQFNIMNHEGREQNYTITVMADGKQYDESVLIQDGRIFTYIHHFYRDSLTDNRVSFAVYKEGEATPFEEETYHLK